MDALRLVLGHGSDLASDGRIADFLHLAFLRNFNVNLLTVVTGGQPTRLSPRPIRWAVLPIPTPGRSALLLTPQTTPRDWVVESAELVTCVTESLSNLTLAQALVDPTDPLASRPLALAGFEVLTTLIYLQRDLKSVRNSSRSPFPPGLREVNYSAATHSVFRTAIERSYEASLDCPRMCEMRAIDDVIEDHKTAGEFDPSIWTVWMDGDTPAAVMLLARMPQESTMELVYLGVVPSHRRRGLAEACVRRAFAIACEKMCQRLTLAVDENNAPALSLYHGQGLRRVHERLAMVKDLRPLSVASAG